jgi:predicted nucleotidyltransferase
MVAAKGARVTSAGQALWADVDRVEAAILPVDSLMTLEAVTNAVQRLESRLRTEFGVAALYVFGSVARGEARFDSDVDVFVEFDGPATFARFMDLKALLEDTLSARVDLVTRAALRSQLKPRIEAEARRVA